MTPKDVAAAKYLADKEQYTESLAIVNRFLRDEDPNNAEALLLAAFLFDKAANASVENRVIAYNFAKRAVAEGPKIAAAWMNLAKIAGDLYLLSESRRAYEMATRCAKSDGDRKMALINYGSALVMHGDFKGCEEVSRKALELGDSKAASGNLGISLLAQNKWKEGWPLYDRIIGAKHLRALNQYANEPSWDGSHNKSVILYGEQGLGDEISFASMLPDAIKDCKKVVIDCDARLEGLFKRSFPLASVYGTRGRKELPWAEEDTKPDASMPMGGLGKFYRPTPDSCPGTPYLVPDPDRLAMWKALWATKGKPVIGLAWSGGMQWTGAKFRKWTLNDLLPMFKAVDAHWVCLQYKDASAEIAEFLTEHPEIDLKQYPFATLTDDYDDTAALVASLDRVVAMQTAVIHLAGALGVPTWVFVYKHSQWRYGVSGDSMPWYKSVRIWRQTSGGAWPIKEAAEQLKGESHDRSEATHH